MGNKAIGALFKSAREAKGMGYSDVARALKIVPQHMNRIEHGRVGPSLPLAFRLCQLLNVDPRDVYFAYWQKESEDDRY